MANLRDKPFIYVTWLSGLLFGSKQCKWAVWYRAHYRSDTCNSMEHNINYLHSIIK